MQHYVEKSPLNLSLLKKEKRIQGTATNNSQHWSHIVRVSILILYYRVAGDVGGATTRSLTVMEKEGGLITTSTWDLVDWVRIYSAQIVILTNIFALWDASGMQSDQETPEWKDLLGSDPPIRRFAVLEPGLSMPREGVESQLYLLWRFSSFIWSEGLVTIPGSSMVKKDYNIELGEQRWSLPKQSQYWAWRAPMVSRGRMINSELRPRIPSSSSQSDTLFLKLTITWSGPRPSYSGKGAKT